MNRKERLLRWLIRLEVLYAKGKDKSKLGFLGDAAVAGGFAATVIQLNLQGLLLGLAVRALLLPLFVGLGFWWKKKGLWDYELEYQTQLNPMFRRIDRNVRNNK